MNCEFKSFSIVFQLNQDDGRLIMKGCMQWNSVYGREDFPLSRDQTRSPRSVGQRLTELLGLLLKRLSSWIELQIRGVIEDNSNIGKTYF